MTTERGKFVELAYKIEYVDRATGFHAGLALISGVTAIASLFNSPWGALINSVGCGVNLYFIDYSIKKKTRLLFLFGELSKIEKALK